MDRGRTKREKLIVYLDHRTLGFYCSPSLPQSRIGVSLETTSDWQISCGHLSQDQMGLWYWEPLPPHANALSMLVPIAHPDRQKTEIHIYAPLKDDDATLALVQRICEEQLAVTPLAARPPVERFRTYFCEPPCMRPSLGQLQEALHAVYRYYWYDLDCPPTVSIESAGIVAAGRDYEHFYTLTLDAKLTCHVYERADGSFRVTTDYVRGNDEYLTRRSVIAIARKHFGWPTLAAMRKSLGPTSRAILTEESPEEKALSFGKIITRLWLVRIGEQHTCFVGKRLHPRSRTLTGMYTVFLSRPFF